MQEEFRNRKESATAARANAQRIARRILRCRGAGFLPGSRETLVSSQVKSRRAPKTPPCATGAWLHRAVVLHFCFAVRLDKHSDAKRFFVPLSSGVLGDID